MTLSKKSLLLTGVAVVATLLIAAPASAITIGFTKITNNGNSNVASQLSADVTDHGDGTVDFTFYNDVGIASSISEIYFDDGTLLALSSISDSGAGVAFTGPPTNPGDLPGGNLASPPFHVSQGFSADSSNPQVANGISLASEWVTINFTLQGGQTFADTIAALTSGDLRIGLHVTGIDGTACVQQSCSDSYVNGVPDGGMTMSLLGMAMAGLGVMARRRK